MNDPEKFATAIIDILEQYKAATDAAVEKAVKETAVETANIIKNSSPSGAGKYHSWAAYLRGWKSKKVNSHGKGVRYVVFNSSKPSLTHLLEKGHALRNGGRANAFPHIKPAEDEVEKKLLSRIIQGIKDAE